MFKKRMLMLCGVMLLAFVLVACGRLSVSFSGSHRNAVSNLTIDGWTYTANTINGRATTNNLELTADNLSQLHVDANFGGGTILLELIQGDFGRGLHLADDFSGYVDTSGFEPGEIRLRLVFTNVQNMDISIRW